MSWVTWTITLMVIAVVGAAAFNAVRSRKFKGKLSVPIVSYRPILRTPWGDKVVAQREMLGRDFYQIMFEDGQVLQVHTLELKPLNPVETMCRNNTPGGRDVWLYRPFNIDSRLKKFIGADRYVDLSVDEYEKFSQAYEDGIDLNERIANETDNAEEKQDLEVKQIGEIAKSSAPRISRTATGGGTR